MQVAGNLNGQQDSGAIGRGGAGDVIGDKGLVNAVGHRGAVVPFDGRECRCAGCRSHDVGLVGIEMAPKGSHEALELL